ncbi:hypothetical protein AMTRI_Chr09g18600 [Amborella trichopoda]
MTRRVHKLDPYPYPSGLRSIMSGPGSSRINCHPHYELLFFLFFFFPLSLPSYTQIIGNNLKMIIKSYCIRSLIHPNELRLKYFIFNNLQVLVWSNRTRT